MCFVDDDLGDAVDAVPIRERGKFHRFKDVRTHARRRHSHGMGQQRGARTVGTGRRHKNLDVHVFTEHRQRLYCLRAQADLPARGGQDVLDENRELEPARETIVPDPRLGVPADDGDCRTLRYADL